MTQTESARVRASLEDRLILFVQANTSKRDMHYLWSHWAEKHLAGGGDPRERSVASRDAYRIARGYCEGYYDAHPDVASDERYALARLREEVTRFVWHGDSEWSRRIVLPDVYKAIQECRRLRAFGRG